jgi:NADPH-dependent glutamate synthase beta subunit-like oxidoreductase
VPLWSDGGLVEYTEPEHQQATDVVRRALKKLADDSGAPDSE